MVHWHRKHRSLSPDAVAIVQRASATWDELDSDGEDRVVALTEEFLDHKEFEGAGGTEIDDEMRLTVAAHACRLVVFHDLHAYRDVHSIIVYPSTVVHRGERRAGGGVACNATPTPILGEAMLHGPIVLAWDAVLRDVRHPEHGRNVVYHEFAHVLDMTTGAADGIPPVGGRSNELRWKAMMDATLSAMRSASHEDPVLGSYAETNAAECFAVATEVFFTTPQRLATSHPDLHRSLLEFYRPPIAG